MIIKNNWFAILDISEIQLQINWKSYHQNLNTVTKTLNTEKQESSNRTEMPSNCNQNTTHPNTTKQTLTQEEKC